MTDKDKSDKENYQKYFVIWASATITAFFFGIIFDSQPNKPTWDLPIHLMIICTITRLVSIFGSLVTLVCGGLWYFERNK